MNARHSAQMGVNMHYNCLIIDDETDLSNMTCEYLEMFGISCACVETAVQCIEFLQAHQVDILLLDINLTDGSGFDLCKRLREQYDMPILFISARQSDDDILIALNIGGDDYIKKPYTLSILLAKLRVILKRMEMQEGQPKAVNGQEAQGKEDIQLFEDKLCVRFRGKEVPLKAREFALFACLYAHKNKIVTKQQLFEQVWGDAYYSDGTLNVHIRRLRQKLEENPNEPELIQTVWGTGYMLKIGEGK